MTRKIALLGPQHEHKTVARTLDELGVDGPVATVTAGWEEREPEDDELAEHLGGRARNLALHARAEELFNHDRVVRELLYERYDRLRELQVLYRLRLAPQLDACRALFALTDPADPGPLYGPELDDAIADLRSLDAHHLARAAALDAEILERLGERDAIRRHVDALALAVEDVEALCIAGGHVGILLNRLRLFSVVDLVGDVPIVAWSGGAMVLAERIVLFHDSPPQGAGDPEVYAPGLGLVRGVVPLPHAGRRLDLNDEHRVALFARRFGPDRVLVFDGGERVLGSSDSSDWQIANGTRELVALGSVQEVTRR